MNQTKCLRTALFFTLSFLGYCLLLYGQRSVKMEQQAVARMHDELEIQSLDKKQSFNIGTWERLKQNNQDFWAWIYWQDRLVSQPVMFDQGDQNYLHWNFDREESISGTPFILDMNAKNKVIYGHHIGYGTDNSVFTKLSELTDPVLFQQYQNFYLYMRDCVQQYTLVAIAVKDTKLHWDYQQPYFANRSQFQKWLSACKQDAILYEDDPMPQYEDELITIQTCTDGYSSKKLILLAVKTKEFFIE